MIDPRLLKGFRDYLPDIMIQKKHTNRLTLKYIKMNISRYNFLILLIGLGIIIISFGITLFPHHYLLAGDRWRGIYFASYLGNPNILSFNYAGDRYYIYWGFISFSLSILSGIPFINTNVLLFPLLYLCSELLKSS